MCFFDDANSLQISSVLLAERRARLQYRLLGLINKLGRTKELGDNPIPTCVCEHPWHFSLDYHRLHKRFGFGSSVLIGEDYPPAHLRSWIMLVNTHERMCPGCVCGNQELGPAAASREVHKIDKEAKICMDCMENNAGAVCSHRG